MVAEIFLSWAEPFGIMWMMTPEQAVYFLAFIFSVAIGGSLGFRFNKPYAGLIGFLASLGGFALIGAFPLWIVALPLIIILLISYYAHQGEGQ